MSGLTNLFQTLLNFRFRWKLVARNPSHSGEVVAGSGAILSGQRPRLACPEGGMRSQSFVGTASQSAAPSFLFLFVCDRISFGGGAKAAVHTFVRHTHLHGQ